MSAAAVRLAPAPGLDDAVVAGAEIVAGHDGAAELWIRLTHGNGASSTLTLDSETGFDLLRAGDAASLADLIGRPWLALIKDL